MMEVLELISDTQAMICWIPSHVGIEGNEKADELAKNALEDPETTNVNNLIRNVDAKTIIKRLSMEAHQKEYEASEKGLKFKSICPKITEKPWYHHNGMNANDIKTINRLITNFSFDKRWLYRFGKADTENCDQCGVAETAEHLVFTCKKYSQSRKNFPTMNNLKTVEDYWRSKAKNDATKDIIRFVKENAIEF